MLSRKSGNDAQLSKINTILGKDAVLEGNFHAKGTTRIDGTIQGDVVVEDMLVLGASGKIIGNVQASVIMVGGNVQGDLSAREKIEISATGRVTGNIRTKKLIIDENAVFQGNCNMDDAGSKKADVQPEAAAESRTAAAKA